MFQLHLVHQPEMSQITCRLKVDLIFDEFSRNVKQPEKIQQITTFICALLNTTGGQLDINMDRFNKHTIHELIRTIEQRFRNIIGALAFSEKIVQQLVTPQKITFVISPIKDYLCTLSYNLCLPSTTGTQNIEPNEPITAIERIVEGKQNVSHRVVAELGSHRRVFTIDEQVGEDFLLTRNVICKHLKGRNAIKNEMTNKQSKFQSQISALANDTGGHIYHGIKSGEVVGIPVKENASQSIICEVEKAVGKLIWGGNERPQRGREWDIYFEPVNGVDGSIIDQTFVIIVSIVPYKGGVFVAEPDCYYVVEGEVKRMSFNTWKTELLRRRTLRQCDSIDEHVRSIASG